MLETNHVHIFDKFELVTQCVLYLDASNETSGQAGLPAEFKHINKRRKRN